MAEKVNGQQHKIEHNELDKELLKHHLEVWKVAIDTQIHFNELLIKMRTTVISVILAVFGATLIAFRETRLYVSFPKVDVHVGIIILVLGLIFLLIQYIIDRVYYFNLLKGSVAFTLQLDEHYSKYKMFGLTKSISSSVSLKAAQCILAIYYLIPFLLGVITIFFFANSGGLIFNPEFH